MEELLVQRRPIRVVTRNGREFLSLTDMAKAKSKDTDKLIANWLNCKNTIDFLGAWEEGNHPLTFNPLGFHGIRLMMDHPRGQVSVKKWVKATNARGIEAVPGRYGGTFAHLEIATEFASWLAPGFKVKLNAALKNHAEWERRADWVRAQYTPFDNMF